MAAVGLLLSATMAATDAAAAPDFGASSTGSLGLSEGHGLYLFSGAVSGEGTLSSMSWQAGQDLAVSQPSAGGQVISIGHGTEPSGSFSYTSPESALAGLGLDGYVVVQSYSKQKLGKAKPKATKPPGKALKAPRVTLPFSTTSPNQIVVVLAAGQGVGALELSGVEVTGSEVATYGPAQSASLASAAAYTAQVPVGKHKARLASTTYSPNAGTALGVVAYVLSPAPPPHVSGVSPSSGPEGGGTSVEITGTDLDGASAVTFGGGAAQSFKVVSPTEIEAVSPPGSGTVDVAVTTERGTSETNSGDQFQYLAPHPVNAYSNYGSATAGHAMCRGNPGRPESMPGGTVTQTFTVPAGVASLSSALVQIDPDSTVAAHLSLAINGVQRATAQAAAAGDTHFSWPAVATSAGDQVSLSISFTATFGKIITVYSAAQVGGLLTFSNSCPDGAPSGTSPNGLRAVVSGMSP